jgi:hypothetical protein
MCNLEPADPTASPFPFFASLLLFILLLSSVLDSPSLLSFLDRLFNEMPPFHGSIPLGFESHHHHSRDDGDDDDDNDREQFFRTVGDDELAGDQVMEDDDDGNGGGGEGSINWLQAQERMHSNPNYVWNCSYTVVKYKCGKIMTLWKEGHLYNRSRELPGSGVFYICNRLGCAARAYLNVSEVRSGINFITPLKESIPIQEMS